MPFQPFMMGDATLTIDGDAFEGEVSGAVFTPSASTVPWTAINSDTYNFTTPATWTLDLTLAQDWAFADALSRYLHDNEGDTVSVVLTPKSGASTATATVNITPGAIGSSDVATVAGSTVSLGSTKPVLSALP